MAASATTDAAASMFAPPVLGMVQRKRQREEEQDAPEVLRFLDNLLELGVPEITAKRVRGVLATRSDLEFFAASTSDAVAMVAGLQGADWGPTGDGARLLQLAATKALGLSQDQTVFGAPEELSLYLRRQGWTTASEIMRNATDVRRHLWSVPGLASAAKDCGFWAAVEFAASRPDQTCPEPAPSAPGETALAALASMPFGREPTTPQEAFSQLLDKKLHHRVTRFWEAKQQPAAWNPQTRKFELGQAEEWENLIPQEGLLMEPEVLNHPIATDAPPAVKAEAHTLLAALRPILAGRMKSLAFTRDEIKEDSNLKTLVILYKKLENLWLAKEMKHLVGVVDWKVVKDYQQQNLPQTTYRHFSAFLYKHRPPPKAGLGVGTQQAGKAAVVGQFLSAGRTRSERGVPADRNSSITCSNCSKVGHWSSACPLGFQGKCNKCGVKGHRAKECRKSVTKPTV